MILFSDEYFMKKAVIEAQNAEKEGEVPIGCVIACNNQIIASAHNLTQQLTDVTAHAEMQAITAASNYLGSKYLNNCTLYVTIEPCSMCAGALGWSQIGKIVYGAKDEKKGYSKITPNSLHPKTVVASGVLEIECNSLLINFFKNKRK